MSVINPSPVDGRGIFFAWTDLPRPAVMGVLNVTPDSFSDGGNHGDRAAAIEAGWRMVRDGADILDIGGESTRPGAEPVAPEDEQRRILPVIAALVSSGVPISVDTRNAPTMARALDAGACIVNDVSGLNHDPAAASLVAARGCSVILMHMRGTPATMNALARYDDVVAAVTAELAARVALAEAAGVARQQIAIDPGFGFAKDAGQSTELLRRLSELAVLGLPLVAGLSRKRFIGALSGAAEPKDRGPGSLAAGLFALAQGAAILRVHDVADTVQAVRTWSALWGKA